jgi:hypothetical protein
MEESSIRSLAQRCDQEFDRRLEDRQQESLGLLNEEYEVLEGQRACFRLWARNMGAFVDGHASLDYRLREVAHQDIALLHRDQLAILERCLKQRKFPDD